MWLWDPKQQILQYRHMHPVEPELEAWCRGGCARDELRP